MAKRILPLILLALSLGASACALQPLDPVEDPVEDQSSSLTSPEQGPPSPATADRPSRASYPLTSGQSPTIAPGSKLASDDNPDKPQPDPWNSRTTVSSQSSTSK
jgi:hypothetical protein